MEQTSKIIWLNLAILLSYTVIIQLISQLVVDPNYTSFAILANSMCAIVAHLVINILLAIFYFFKKEKHKGKAFLLSSLIILLVGFSACWGSSFLGKII